MYKKISFILIELLFLQVLRFLFKITIFLFAERTLFADVIVNSLFMLIMIAIMIFMIKKQKKDLNILPKKHIVVYIILSIVLFAFIVSTPIITKNYSLYDILFLIYGSIITVIYEELIFRGFVWDEIKNTKNDLIAYILSTILFGIWHLGYIDTVLWRTSLFHPNTDIVNIMFWKVITGAVLGIFFGFLRYKNKNIYSSMLLHSFINAFGS